MSLRCNNRRCAEYNALCSIVCCIVHGEVVLLYLRLCIHEIIMLAIAHIVAIVGIFPYVGPWVVPSNVAVIPTGFGIYHIPAVIKIA